MNRREGRFDGWSDARLVAACRTGDPLAWRALVDRYRRLVYGVPRMLGLQPADADEAFQQTFTRLHRALPGLREDGKVGAWLATTARRAALRLMREARRRRHLEEAGRREVATSMHRAGIEEALERLQLRELVRRELDTLGDPCRTLVLGTMADPPVPYRVLASRLGLAVGSLGSTRARCLERLRRRLGVLAGRGSPA